MLPGTPVTERPEGEICCFVGTFAFKSGAPARLGRSLTGQAREKRRRAFLGGRLTGAQRLGLAEAALRQPAVQLRQHGPTVLDLHRPPDAGLRTAKMVADLLV